MIEPTVEDYAAVRRLLAVGDPSPSMYVPHGDREHPMRGVLLCVHPMTGAGNDIFRPIEGADPEQERDVRAHWRGNPFYHHEFTALDARHTYCHCGNPQYHEVHNPCWLTMSTNGAATFHGMPLDQWAAYGVDFGSVTVVGGDRAESQTCCGRSDGTPQPGSGALR